MSFASLGKQPPKSSLRAVRSVTAAVVNDEQVTRGRVDRLEAWARASATITAGHMDFIQMGLGARLRWVMTGALPVRPQPEDTTKDSGE